MHDCEQFAEALINEIGARAMLENQETIQHHEDLAAEIREMRRLIADPGTPDQIVLSAAFGVVDTYLGLRWRELVSEVVADSRGAPPPDV